MKQGRPGYEPPRVVLRAYTANVRLCVFSHLNVYIRSTKSYHGKIDMLFLTHKNPFKAATLNTISRWLKETLHMAGIDTTKFGPGSGRAAVTSKAAHLGVPINFIMRTAGWS